MASKSVSKKLFRALEIDFRFKKIAKIILKTQISSFFVILFPTPIPNLWRSAGTKPTIGSKTLPPKDHTQNVIENYFLTKLQSLEKFVQVFFKHITNIKKQEKNIKKHVF